ncbi:MAG: hypothetical protein ACJA0N_002066 [Pseudohongiellaceae bacterium]|jgi:hypothetical protein
MPVKAGIHVSAIGFRLKDSRNDVKVLYFVSLFTKGETHKGAVISGVVNTSTCAYFKFIIISKHARRPV